MKRTGRMVAQMKFRARDFHRTLYSPFLSDPLLLFYPPASFISLRRQNTSAAAESISGRRGPARRYAGEYLSERKTNSLCIQPCPFRPRAEGGWNAEGGSAVCLRKKVTPSGEPQLRASHCLRGGGPEQDAARGEEGDGIRRG